MFTGLVQAAGMVMALSTINEGKELTIKAPTITEQISLGDSVAVNGVCLTVTKIQQDSFCVQAVHVTLKKTTIGMLHMGDLVNLELALKATDRLGGHFVQGHVNGVGKIIAVTSRGNNYEVTVAIEHELMRYIIKEGSIALDGMSLTIADRKDDCITVSIIPHTWQVTHLHKKKVGDSLNVEVDILAKYVEHLIRHQPKKVIDYTLLNEQGF